MRYLMLALGLLLAQTIPAVAKTTEVVAVFRAPASKTDNGILRRVLSDDGRTEHFVLELRGTHRQMGYAHGYLLAEPITQLFGCLVGPDGLLDSPERYAALLEIARTRMRFAERYEQELTGILRGMRDRLGADRLRLEPLGRPLDGDDLKALQCVADWLPMMCSSFSA